MTNQKENIETANLNNLKCPSCGKELPHQLFMDYLKSNFFRLFLITYAISFSLIMIAINIKAQISGATPLTINPYQASLTIAGIISIIGWYNQKRKMIEKLKANNG